MGITIIVMAGLAGWRASSDPSKASLWLTGVDQGEAVPFTTPALLSNGLVWQQNEDIPGLVYRSFDANEHSSKPPIPIVAYPDVFPQEWQVSPSLENKFHLVWLEQDGRLRNALIDRTGQTVRGPIELAPMAQPGFSVIPYKNRLLVLWLDSSGQVSITELDESGRPRPPQRPIPEQVQFVAGGLNQTNLHLAWLVSSSANQWTIQYQVSPVDQVNTETPTSLLTFSLSPTEMLTSFSMGVDQEFMYLLWSTSQDNQPDRERVFMWAFPLYEPQNGMLSEVLLSAPIRWASPIIGQQTRLVVALAIQTSSGWRPAVAFFQGGQLLDFQSVAPQAANAGSPAAVVDENGAVQLAWVSRQGAVSHLLLTGSEEHAEDLTDALLAGLVRLPLAFLWLFIPVGLIWISPRFVPLALIIYIAAQMLWPRDLFRAIPPLLTVLDHFQPAFAVGFTVLLIGLFAGLVYRCLSRSWLAFFLVDALLIWLIFGANMG